MNEFLIVYAVLVLITVPEFLGIASIVMGGSVLVYWLIKDMSYNCNDDEWKQTASVWGKRAGIIFAIAMVADLFVPTKEEIAYIIGGGMSLKAVQSEEVQNLPENIVSAMNRFLEEID